jgi:tetratricopeptide (TPR) repeat protein
VTFLFTDIEGSTRRWEQHPEGMGRALARHDILRRAAIEKNGGHVFKTMGDQFCTAFATASDAVAAALAAQRALLSRRGEYEAARALLEESLAPFREAGDRQAIGVTLCYLATMSLDQGHVGAATRYCREGLEVLRDAADRYAMVQALESLARVTFARKEPQRAARLFGAAASQREVLGAPVSPADRATLERQVDAARASLAEEAFATAWAEGWGMTLEEAAAAAFESCDTAPLEME